MGAAMGMEDCCSKRGTEALKRKAEAGDGFAPLLTPSTQVASTEGSARTEVSETAAASAEVADTSAAQGEENAVAPAEGEGDLSVANRSQRRRRTGGSEAMERQRQVSPQAEDVVARKPGSNLPLHALDLGHERNQTFMPKSATHLKGIVGHWEHVEKKANKGGTMLPQESLDRRYDIIAASLKKSKASEEGGMFASVKGLFG
eukprot:TRINITY_DN20223_c0_g1_i1.p1 TRINITY_DN20223_c0_g1~~TRINITY_DN20223_c0_g1_i1.p1  ORF type:complete len:228 (+),score=52.89 TRINITY_DN20223_c0_g1_i1:77-685(+)